MASAIGAGKPVLGERNQIVLFGGHGSTTTFSSVAAKRAQSDSDQSASGAIFLLRCHAAFLEECLGLEYWLLPKLGLNLTDFQNPKNFLIPPESLQKNAVVQATTICLYQLLRYIAEVERPNSQLDASGKQVLETVGVCSGLLPAAVVATSATTSELIENGVSAIRLAFRIACRSAIYGHCYTGGKGNNGSWTLIVKGLDRAQAEEKLENYYAHVSDQTQLGISLMAVRSNYLGSTTIYPLICYFKRKYGLSDWTQCRTAFLSRISRLKRDG